MKTHWKGRPQEEDEVSVHSQRCRRGGRAKALRRPSRTRLSREHLVEVGEMVEWVPGQMQCFLFFVLFFPTWACLRHLSDRKESQMMRVTDFKQGDVEA